MHSRTAYLRRARHWIANRGWGGFLRQIRWRLGLILQGKPIPGRPGPEKGPHPFDVAHHVETAGLVWGEALDETAGSPGDARLWATGYYGISPSAFDAALSRLALDWPRFTFLDIGCGKGRALLLATRFPFRRLLGIELSPALAALAQRNLATFQAPWRHPALGAGDDIHIQVADATAVPLPGGPLLLFLYHPFAAPVMQRFLDHVRAAARAEPRDIYLLYTNPELAPLLERTPGVTRLWDQWTAMTADEIAADRFNSVDEHTILYRMDS